MDPAITPTRMNLRQTRADLRVELRDGILLAAAEILATEGPAALTLRRLAQEVGASTKVVYTLFGGKDGLLDALYLSAFEGLAMAQRKCLEVDEAGARLIAICQAYRRYALDHRALYGVMFGELARGYEAPIENRRQAWETFRTLRDTLRACAPGRDIAELDLAARTLWSVIHGVVSLELQNLLGGAPETAEQAFDRAVSAVLRDFKLA